MPTDAAARQPDFARTAIPAAAAFAAMTAAVGVVALIGWRDPAPRAPALVAIEIGGRRLEIDSRLLQAGPQRSGGKLERVDMVLGWPEFGPAARLARDQQGRPSLPAPSAHVLASLRPAEGPDPATRALDVHGRFVEPEIWSNPGGLLVRRFKAGSPFAGEELVMTPDAKAFSARCPVAGSAGGLAEYRCLATFRLGGLDATVSFDPSLLPEWRALKGGVLAVLGRAIR